MGKPTIPEGVTVRQSILHPYYRVGNKGYDTVVRGISTAIIAGRFRAGEWVHQISEDYDIGARDVDVALRWELHDRRWRVERVREAVLRGGATRG